MQEMASQLTHCKSNLFKIVIVCSGMELAMDLLQIILAVIGGVSTVGAAGAVIYKVIRPVMQIVKRVNVLEINSRKDYERLQALEQYHAESCKALFVLFENATNSDHIGKVDIAKEEFQKFLIER
jgi:hypothetical protein